MRTAVFDFEKSINLGTILMFKQHGYHEKLMERPSKRAVFDLKEYTCNNMIAREL